MNDSQYSNCCLFVSLLFRPLASDLEINQSHEGHVSSLNAVRGGDIQGKKKLPEEKTKVNMHKFSSTFTSVTTV